ncbi:hypothetical protein [Mesorhizobium sp. M0019]|uniref:hypothetical protein n=1 Tax=Mesorhizobium sp. M0019 TaxID=2956845 RepID=UPI003339E711
MAKVLNSIIAIKPPGYRQSQIYARHGVDLACSSLASRLAAPAVGWKRCTNARRRTCSHPIIVASDTAMPASINQRSKANHFHR